MLKELALIKVPQKRDFNYYLKMAEPDLIKILAELKNDSLRTKAATPRYFNEVKGDPLAWKARLEVMKKVLTGAK
jgi:hypothetical protein